MSPPALTLSSNFPAVVAESAHAGLILTGIGLFTFIVVYQLVLYPFYFSPLRTLPGPPLGPNFLIGRFADILNGEAGIPQREWVKKYGKRIRVVGPIGLERVIFSGTEALQRILNTNWISNPRPTFVREILGFVTGYGLLTVTGYRHKQMRKAMNPAFSIPNLAAQTDMYYKPICGYERDNAFILPVNLHVASTRLLAILDCRVKETQDGSSVEVMSKWMNKVTLDIICLTGPTVSRFIAIFSIPGISTLLLSEFAWRHHNVLAKLPLLAPISTLLDAMHRIKAVSASILREKLKEAEYLENNEDRTAKKDIMSLLVRARRADQKAKGPKGGVSESVPYAMSDSEMMDQVLTFLGAGHDTTASGLVWTLWLLAKNPMCQQKLREEIIPHTTMSDTDDLRKIGLGYRELKDLVWLDCVVQESLRLYPPVPMTFRQAATTDYVDGVLVPKGTLYYIPIRVVNTLKDIWGEDAEEFNPSRWLSEKCTGSTPPTLTFLAGPHACIAKTMAIIEMKAVIAALVANFEFSPSYEGQEAIPTAAITMKPADGMPLKVRKVEVR
ncbi:cytochrome P450 [Lentinula raphanica]|nr:cytochrome P450 [Lentinula raphanica]